MPELPEVETTLRGVSPHLRGATVIRVLVRNGALRYPVDPGLDRLLAGQPVRAQRRRGKYLLLGFPAGTVMVHLGMSGSLRLVPAGEPPGRHDHVDLELDTGLALRYTDPRRFGLMLWCASDPDQHFLLRELGPEPLAPGFSGDYLRRRAGGRSMPVKSFLMDSRIVVGVGNIYANEALFLAGIHPLRRSGRISRPRYDRLASAVKTVLTRAIEQGGTTLRNFVGGDGKPGYFKQSLNVYGRGGEPCPGCGKLLREVRLNNRATVYCTRCQR
jgi:formamidopyrimidine-DNA glycosylase